MASVFVVATEERVREAYARTRAEPACRVVVQMDPWGQVRACAIGVIAYDQDRSLLRQLSSTSEAMRIAGIDADHAAEGFVQGWDASVYNRFYGSDRQQQAEYDRGYQYGETMRQSVWANWTFSDDGKEQH